MGIRIVLLLVFVSFYLINGLSQKMSEEEEEKAEQIIMKKLKNHTRQKQKKYNPKVLNVCMAICILTMHTYTYICHRCCVKVPLTSNYLLENYLILS